MSLVWLYEQVPCNLACGDATTYEDTGAETVWIKGTKADAGKRFCTLQVCARAHNGSAEQPRHGQPRLEICFKGQGKRITEEEKRGWNPDVSVRFQPKAWYDRPTSDAWAEELLSEITAAARRKNMETVLFADGLDSQTTETFRKILRKNGTKRHLGVSNATDITQLVDMGLGRALKVRIGVLQDEWLAEDDNDEL